MYFSVVVAVFLVRVRPPAPTTPLLVVEYAGSTHALLYVDQPESLRSQTCLNESLKWFIRVSQRHLWFSEGNSLAVVNPHLISKASRCNQLDVSAADIDD